MSQKVKAVGPEIFVHGYILSGKGGDLSKRLEATVSVLADIKQEDPRPEGLDNVAAALIHASILQAKSQVRHTGWGAEMIQRAGVWVIKRVG
jgi:hypothetical protein